MNSSDLDRRSPFGSVSEIMTSLVGQAVHAQTELDEAWARTLTRQASDLRRSAPPEMLALAESLLPPRPTIQEFHVAAKVSFAARTELSAAVGLDLASAEKQHAK